MGDVGPCHSPLGDAGIGVERQEGRRCLLARPNQANQTDGRKPAVRAERDKRGYGGEGPPSPDHASAVCWRPSAARPRWTAGGRYSAPLSAGTMVLARSRGMRRKTLFTAHIQERLGNPRAVTQESGSYRGEGGRRLQTTQYWARQYWARWKAPRLSAQRRVDEGSRRSDCSTTAVAAPRPGIARSGPLPVRRNGARRRPEGAEPSRSSRTARGVGAVSGSRCPPEGSSG